MNNQRPVYRKRLHVGRFAMTLVELMVAIALSAMLMAALVGVLSGISRQREAIRPL